MASDLLLILVASVWMDFPSGQFSIVLSSVVLGLGRSATVLLLLWLVADGNHQQFFNFN